jgi:hypothetical protein
MKVRQLKRILERCDDDMDVFISVELPFITCGGTPVAGIKSARIGFDWDSGKIIIEPAEGLSPIDRKFKAKFKRLQEKVGSLDYENRGLKRKIKKLIADVEIAK